MPEDTSGAQSGQEPTGTPAGQEPTETGLDAAAAQEALRAARREAASYRTRLAALERAQQDAETAKLSEADKLAKRAAALQAELEQERADKRDRINRYEVQLQASRLGIVDPEAAVKLLDWSSLEYGEDGSPKELDRALQALVKQRPWLLGQAGQPQAGATNPARNHSQGQMTLADVKRLSKEQIATMTAEQRAQMYDALARG